MSSRLFESIDEIKEELRQAHREISALKEKRGGILIPIITGTFGLLAGLLGGYFNVLGIDMENRAETRRKNTETITQVISTYRNPEELRTTLAMLCEVFSEEEGGNRAFCNDLDKFIAGFSTTVIGHVYDGFGRPLSGVKVTNGINNTEIFSDSRGIYRIDFNGLEGIVQLYLKFEKEGYLADSFTASIEGRAITKMDMVIEKKK